MTASQDITSTFNEVYDGTHREVLAFITAKCGNTEDISDIFQETYMSLYQSLERNGAAYAKDSNRLVYKIAKTTEPKQPLASYAERESFKLYMLDAGLLPAKSGLEMSTFYQSGNSNPNIT